MAANLLALDLGTSSINCMVTEGCGTPLAAAEAPVRYFTPSGFSELTWEFAPQEVLDTLGSLVVNALKEAKTQGSKIKSIGITSQRQGVVFLDSKGKELLTSPNVDLRAIFEGVTLDEELGPEIYSVTGHLPSLLLAPARIQWLQQNQPDNYKRLSRLLTMAGWLAFRLTCNAACEPSLAAGAGLLDVKNRERCTALLKRLNVPESVLPPLVQAGDVVGGLIPELADRWGLQPGTAVTLAGADTQCGLLGMGLASSGQTGAIAGWSCALQVLTTKPCYDIAMDTWVGCYPTEDLWVAESNLGDAGNAHRWLKDTLLGSDVPWEVAEELATVVPAGSNGVLCFLGPGPLSAGKAGLSRGGLLFPTPLRFQETSQGQLLHAFLENLAYSMKTNLDTLNRVTGLQHDVLYIGGGMARSETLARIIADVLDCEIRRSSVSQVSVRGAALVAAVAAGFYSTMREAVESSLPLWQPVEPDSINALEYQEHYQEWVELYHKLQDSKVNLE